MTKKQNYTAPEVEALEVKTEGVVMLSKEQILSVMAVASIEEATDYGVNDDPIKW